MIAANGKITPEHVVKHADLIKESDFVIAQFESDLASTIKAFEVAHQAGVKSQLDLSLHNPKAHASSCQHHRYQQHR